MTCHPGTGASAAHMLAVMMVAITVSAASSAARAETPLERGSYLVNAVMACDGCHTPRQAGGFAMERRFSGGSQTWDTPAYTVKGANITPDKDTGIGAWSDDDLKRADSRAASKPASARTPDAGSCSTRS